MLFALLQSEKKVRDSKGAVSMRREAHGRLEFSSASIS